MGDKNRTRSAAAEAGREARRRRFAAAIREALEDVVLVTEIAEELGVKLTVAQALSVAARAEDPDVR